MDSVNDISNMSDVEVGDIPRAEDYGDANMDLESDGMSTPRQIPGGFEFFPSEIMSARDVPGVSTDRRVPGEILSPEISLHTSEATDRRMPAGLDALLSQSDVSPRFGEDPTDRRMPGGLSDNRSSRRELIVSSREIEMIPEDTTNVVIPSGFVVPSDVHSSYLGMMNEFSVDEVMDFPAPLYDVEVDDYSPSIGSVSEFEDEVGINPPMSVRFEEFKYPDTYRTPPKKQKPPQEQNSAQSERTPSSVQLNIDNSPN
jgi:hypothetical protein